MANQHSTLDEIGRERIPDELLPEGVGPAWWDPQIMRLHAEAHCAHRYDHEMTTKAWVILHLMNERERLEEQLEAAQRHHEAAVVKIHLVEGRANRAEEQLKAAQRDVAFLMEHYQSAHADFNEMHDLANSNPAKERS